MTVQKEKWEERLGTEENLYYARQSKHKRRVSERMFQSPMKQHYGYSLLVNHSLATYNDNRIPGLRRDGRTFPEG